jgi:tRNA(adenine34) deaminase
MSLPTHSHSFYMLEALKQAQMGFDADEVPVGAVIVCKDKIIARAHNLSQRLNDVTAHAEIQAYTAAASYLGNKYLNDCILYVTLEPCVMCAGALFWSQIGTIVYGASDPKRGFLSASEKTLLHPKTQLFANVLAAESACLLKSFFAKKRL